MDSVVLRQMVTHAKSWAESQGLARTNPVHGKTEYRIPTDFKFSNRGIDRTTTRASSSAEVEAGLFLDMPSHLKHIMMPGRKGHTTWRRGWSHRWQNDPDSSMKILGTIRTRMHMHMIYIYPDAMWWIISFPTEPFECPRKGAHCENTGLNQGDKGKGKGKKSNSFPVLQVGSDPYSHGLNIMTRNAWNIVI